VVASSGLLTMTATGALAQSASAATDAKGAEPSERVYVPGERSFVELNALAGTFVGLRLKGIIHPTRTFSLALEGLEGARLNNVDGSFLRAERALGARAEFCASSSRHQAAIIAPGLALAYLPRDAPTSSWLFDYKGRDPALLLEANADFMVLHEFARHAGVLVGLRGGAVVGVRGHDGSGKRLAGATRPDLAFYLGARF